ncbi:ACP S-malonyltransferase [Paenibacillus durus]|uniref:[acyl-carrier-protein] S-malonyltransferase n=1 Tax=Paenibacillus durus TaxID=44251 RepID=A0A089HKK1_PAEDU|nr:ACP S-malonyltransferase [Paenibacillus durus]AIQ12466.1 malonyl CoA-ACP transacylase [Paenibacillus durus]
MTIFVFPGQGSQVKGMGGNLFNEFRELTAQADDILGYSIRELCMEDPNSTLGQTQYTQPALFVVSALSYLKRIKETGRKPDFVAGHSLGEYNALFAAGAFDFETGLKLVKKRGELMSLATGGGMAVVLGITEENIVEVLKQNGLYSIDIANVNSPYQIALSGLKEDIDQARPIFEATPNVQLFIPLNVSGAFHSRYMTDARLEFEKILNTCTFYPLSIPVISNVYARPYKRELLQSTLAEQINSSVKWTESIRYLMGLGESVFEEIGPGRVLTGLVERIQREATPLVIDTPEQVEEEPAPKPMEPSEPSHSAIRSEITAFLLGNPEFKNEYHLKYAYLTGGMHYGIASEDLVIKMGKAGMMGFLGTHGMELPQIDNAIRQIQKNLNEGQAYGVNLFHNPADPEREEKLVDLYLALGVKVIEASAFLTVTPALIIYHAKGLKRDVNGRVVSSNRIIAKVSRPEVAEAFLSPAPRHILDKLLQENKITLEEADMSENIPIADDICAESDSGGYTDGASAYTLIPAMMSLRDEMKEKYHYHNNIRVGAAGGIGTPQAAAAAFILGADFILTGSINQCTVEARTNDVVKDLLQQINVQDTDYVPYGNMFETGVKVQVLKKGVFFPARAKKLYDLYCQHHSLDEIDEKTRIQIQDKYFKRSFNEVYEEVKAYSPEHKIHKADQNPKQKMALIFRWYFEYSNRLALSGSKEHIVDYQVYCGSALGAFNQWVKGTDISMWRNRHVDEIGEKIMNETAKMLNQKFTGFLGIKEL